MPQRKVGPVGLFPTHSTTQNFPQNYTTSKFAYPGPANSANIQPAERVNGCTQYRFWGAKSEDFPYRKQGLMTLQVLRIETVQLAL